MDLRPQARSSALRGRTGGRSPAADASSDVTHGFAAKQSVRNEDQREQDDDEGRDLLEAGLDIAGGKLLGDTDQDATDDGARNAGETAKNRGRESLDKEDEAHVRIE